MKWTRVTAVMLLVIAAQSWASDPDSPPASPPEAAAATGTGEWQSRERGTATLPWQVEIEKFGDGAVLGWLRVLGSDYGKVQLVGRVDGNDVYGNWTWPGVKAAEALRAGE